MNTRLSPSIAIFGGTFDPVHFGHLRAAEEVRESLNMDRFHLLPCGEPPHRPSPIAGPAQRVEMLRHAVDGLSGFTVDTREVDRPGPSYMVNTLEDFRAEYPHSTLVLIIGQDAANSLDRWYRWRELLRLSHLVIISRHGDTAAYTAEVEKTLSAGRLSDQQALLQGPAGNVFELSIDSLPISSSAIREMILTGRSPRFLLPGRVLDYVVKNHLYLRQEGL